MIKRLLVFVLVFSLVLPYASIANAQFSDISQITSALEQASTKNDSAPQQSQEKTEVYKKFQCPSCSRDFELSVDPNDIELKKGIRKLVCPYDGTEFYPKAYQEKQEEMQYGAVRCPECQKEFKAYVDVNSILAGNPQVLVCPYDNKKFYFKAEGLKTVPLIKANYQTVICPTDKRQFKAYIDPSNPKELACPYDGTKFFPTPDLIIPKMAYAGVGAAPSTLIPGGVVETEERMDVSWKYSSIEEMFTKSLPMTISKDIRQFGYGIFQAEGKRTRTEKGTKDETKAQGQGESKILSALLGSKEQEGVVSGGGAGGLSMFATPAEVPTIADYILGPGDGLKISVWGQINETFSLTVDPEGKVLLPKTGPIYVWGLKFSEAEKLIKDNMLKGYTNIQISVAMERLRGIKVFVLGEVNMPGAYTVSSLANSFHALYAAGGPTKLGTLRRIKLIRRSIPERTIDLYDMLLKGDNSQDYKLEAGDTVFVPPIGDVAGVAGNVKRPAIYELRDKIRLSEMLETAGGISSVGYLQRIQIERVQEHLRKVVLDLEFKSIPDLKSSQNNLDIQDGDLILIFPITPVRYNFISINGNVLRPGDYELKPGLRLKDLIDKAGGILPSTYLQRAEIARFRGDQTRELIPVNLADLIDGKEEANIQLKEWDLITVYSKVEIMPSQFVEIDGSVNKPGKYELAENMKVSDLIFRGGGLKTNVSMGNAELFRSGTESGSKIFKIDLGKALSKDPAEYSKEDLVLDPGDHLFIRGDASKEEKFVIMLSGEFKYPGKYAVEKGTRLSTVIARAGGFTNSAFFDGSVYTRESVRIAQQKMIKGFLDSEQKALLQEQSTLAVGLTTAQAESRDKLIEYRKQLMDKLSVMDVPGRILIRLNPELNKFAGSEYDITVEDGDTFSLPANPSTVQVVGNVYGPGTVVFSDGKGMEYYINKVGGLTKYADANRIFVIRANGETISSFVRAVKIRRGDTIIVPEEFKYRTLPGIVFKDLVQVLYQITLGAVVTITAINTL